MITIDSETCLDVPPEVATCPYCGAALTVKVTGSVQEDDGSWLPDEVDVTCASEPADVMGKEWREFLDSHSYMPYVNWHPMTEDVKEWAQANYRVAE